MHIVDFKKIFQTNLEYSVFTVLFLKNRRSLVKSRTEFLKPPVDYIQRIIFKHSRKMRNIVFNVFCPRTEDLGEYIQRFIRENKQRGLFKTIPVECEMQVLLPFPTKLHLGETRTRFISSTLRYIQQRCIVGIYLCVLTIQFSFLFIFI